MSDHVIKQGDRLPAVGAVLGRSDGTVVNLGTATSVYFVMRIPTATTPKVNHAATITDSVNGVVVYNWLAGDTDTPGTYEGSWIVNFQDGTRETFPTDDYLEIDIQLDLSTSGTALAPVRPTDGIRPRVTEVGALLANRGSVRGGTQFGPGSIPSYTQVQSIISSVAAEIDGDLNGVAVTPKLASLARWCITLAAAATVELTFWPEQASTEGSTSGILWSRYQGNLSRLRDLLSLDGTGAPEFGSAAAKSPTLTALAAVTANGGALITSSSPWGAW